ncbi:GHMP family kinase ATP-binding protein [Peptostreptococcus faecalis]|uniref:GHMP family kinase ATP-binding protein n=1 Tax=Peptostreptococcus faecalis TaxID=2045015 RepID=UPI000C7A8E65|nr:cobalamin biosynthesis protein [Peptostreptococcus faecalis]
MKKGYGMCPGTCGELVQGYIDKNEYISSYCVDMYSRATVSESHSSSNYYKTHKIKSLRAIEYVFERFGIDKSKMQNIRLSIKSEIPTSKGMASSTADIGASIMAALDFLGENLDADEISKIVSKIEPTDAIFHENVCIFDPIHGEKKEDLGKLNFEKVLILEPFSKISTIKTRDKKGYYRYLNSNKTFTKRAFELLKSGFEQNDVSLIARACENSALANEKIKNTPYLRELLSISKECNCAFLNISHTGTVVGLVIDSSTDNDKLLHEIKKSNASNIYTRKYFKKIIEGGLSKGY